MAEISTMEMLSYIRSFVSKMNDYDPLELDGINGCYNTKYHGNLCQATINPPVSRENPTSYPKTIIAYILVGDEVVVCDSSLDYYRLSECMGASIENVYNEIRQAANYKRMYENQKEGI